MAGTTGTAWGTKRTIALAAACMRALAMFSMKETVEEDGRSLRSPTGLCLRSDT